MWILGRSHDFYLGLTPSSGLRDHSSLLSVLERYGVPRIKTMLAVYKANALPMHNHHAFRPNKNIFNCNFLDKNFSYNHFQTFL